MKAKIRKLESQFAQEPTTSTIFAGIRVYVNGHTGIFLFNFLIKLMLSSTVD